MDCNRYAVGTGGNCPSGRRPAAVGVKVAFAGLLCKQEAALPQSPDVSIGNMGLKGPWLSSSCSGGKGLGQATGAGALLGRCPGSSLCLTLVVDLETFFFELLAAEEEELLLEVFPPEWAWVLIARRGRGRPAPM